VDRQTETSTTPFDWSVHPAAEHVGRTAVAVVVVAMMAVLSGLLMQSVVWGVGAGCILLLTLNRFFFRSRFTIDEEGITARYPLSRKRARWPELRAFVLDEHGGYLSTQARRSRLRAPRGLHVYFGRQRDAVVDRIRSRLPEGVGRWA
jgi:hypothetical protein